MLRLGRTNHPHREELRATTIRMTQRGFAVFHLMLAGCTTNLHGCFGKTNHAGRANRVGGKHTTGTVPGNIAALVE